METTLVLIKPDAVEAGNIGRIITIYEDNNLIIDNMRMIYASVELLEKHYAEHIGKDFYPSLIEFMTNGPVVALAISGEDAIARVRELNGATNPKNAIEGTIRKLYAESTSRNAVHASDSRETAEKEIALWFPSLR